MEVIIFWDLNLVMAATLASLHCFLAITREWSVLLIHKYANNINSILTT